MGRGTTRDQTRILVPRSNSEMLTDDTVFRVYQACKRHDRAIDDIENNGSQYNPNVSEQTPWYHNIYGYAPSSYVGDTTAPYKCMASDDVRNIEDFMSGDKIELDERFM